MQHPSFWLSGPLGECKTRTMARGRSETLENLSLTRSSGFSANLRDPFSVLRTVFLSCENAEMNFDSQPSKRYNP